MKQYRFLLLTALFSISLAAHAQVIISDNYTATPSGTGFSLGSGVNVGINPPTTRLTGTAADNLRYYQTAGTRPASLFDINANRLRVSADTVNTTIGRFTLSDDGTTPFNFASALGTGGATAATPAVYDLKISMRNNASGTQRFSFALGTGEGDANNWDFAVQLYRATTSDDFYTIRKRIDQGSYNGATTTTATGDINLAMGTTAPGTWVSGSQATIPFLIRVTDAGAETGSDYNSRVQVSIDNGSSWIYDTGVDSDVLNRWRLDGPGRFIMFDQAGNSSGSVFYDSLSMSLLVPVPEPSTFALAGLGGAGMLWLRLRRKR